MNADKIVSIIEENFFDPSRLPKSPFLNENWTRHIFPMPTRLDEDEDYSCFSKEVIEAIHAATSNTNEIKKIYILNYLVFGSELASEYPDINFFWETDFSWDNINKIMAEKLSYMGLCIFDGSFEWMLISVADEYSILGCNELICNNFEKFYKNSSCIFNDFSESIKNRHTFISEDVAKELLSIYQN